MTHGTALVKSLRTRNKFSATSVDQLPHQLLAHLMYGHQLFLPIPDIDRTSYFLVFGANPMASNGSLMTVPDFPNRLRELKARGGRMVVFDPRRTETAKVATEHHFVRPGHRRVRAARDAARALRRGPRPRPPAYVDGLDAVERAVADFTPELAEQHQRRPRRRDPADRPRARGGRRGGGVRPGRRLDARLRHRVPVGGPAAQPADRQPRPRGRRDVHLARRSTPSARGLIGRGHHDVWRSRVRGLPGVRRRAAGLGAARGDRDARATGQIRAMLTLSGNPVLSTPDGAALDRRARRARLHGRRRHLRQRDHPARRRDPAADDRAGARPLRPGLPRAGGAQHRALHPGGVARSRDGAMHDWEIYREVALRTRSPAAARSRRWRKRLEQRARLSLSPTLLVALLLRAGASGATMRRCGPTRPGVDLGPLRPASCPSRLQHREQAHRRWRPTLVLADLDRLRGASTRRAGDELLLIGRRHQRDCNSWMHNTERLTKGKAAPPAAHAPRRPRRPRPRRRAWSR